MRYFNTNTVDSIDHERFSTDLVFKERIAMLTLPVKKRSFGLRNSFLIEAFCHPVEIVNTIVIDPVSVFFLGMFDDLD